MRKYEEREENKKTGYVTIVTYIERILHATPKKNMFGWENGTEYPVNVQPIDSRFCIYKATYKGPSGYKIYASLEALEEDFICIKGKEEIRRREENGK